MLQASSTERISTYVSICMNCSMVMVKLSNYSEGGDSRATCMVPRSSHFIRPRVLRCFGSISASERVKRCVVIDRHWCLRALRNNTHIGNCKVICALHIARSSSCSAFRAILFDSSLPQSYYHALDWVLALTYIPGPVLPRMHTSNDYLDAM